jgi:hypothetical protein
MLLAGLMVVISMTRAFCLARLSAANHQRQEFPLQTRLRVGSQGSSPNIEFFMLYAHVSLGEVASLLLTTVVPITTLLLTCIRSSSWNSLLATMLSIAIGWTLAALVRMPQIGIWDISKWQQISQHPGSLQTSRAWGAWRTRKYATELSLRDSKPEEREIP